MKFSILKSNFIEGLKSVQNIVAGKGTLPILQNVLLEANGTELKMTTTDIDISMRITCECEVAESGSTTLPVKFLFNSVAKLSDGSICVEVDSNENAVISAGSAKFRLVGMPESEFPRLPKEDDAYVYTISQDTLREMLRKTAYAASHDDTRRTLKGVLMSFRDSKITMVATDGRRLALVEKELEFSKSAERDIVLPAKTVQELQRALAGEEDASMMVQKSQVCFKLGNLFIYSKLIDDVYPDYRKVIPTGYPEQISVDRQLLIDALDRASVMTMDEAHSTKLTFSRGKLKVSSAATNIGEASDEVPIKYAGNDMEIMFNPAYVMEPLKAIDDDEVTIHIKNGNSPAIINCSVPFIYVLMPLRVS